MCGVRIISLLCLFLFCVQAISEPLAVGVKPRERVIMGWLETVFIMPWGQKFTAKLDTGASISSLHADSIVHFAKNGEEWVRFRLSDPGDAKPETVEGERPLVRTAYIKSHGEMSSKRDVVMLTVCKNGHEYLTEFNLVDRSNFNYPVLLGRSFLKDVALVDSSQTFLFKGDSDQCKERKSAIGVRN
jgi:hypothetical protein